MSHISILMENQPGALSRVVGLFSQRGYNIDSLSVAPTNDSSLSRLTMVVKEEESVISQILKQLNKVIDVVEVQNLSDVESVSLEIAIVKLKITEKEAKKIIESAFPVVGEIKGHNGVFVAVMHSGVTLAPLIGQLLASEMLKSLKSPLLETFRPSRFVN